MKKTYFEYYSLTEDEIKNLWKEALFVVDANVLLDLYRYTEETSNDLLSIIKKLKEKNQLWIPHQVGNEFHKNRREIIYEQQIAYDKVVFVFKDGLKNYIENSLKNYLQHPLLKGNEYLKSILNSAKRITSKINKLKIKHPKWDQKDIVLDKVTEYFNGCVGDGYEKNRLLKIYEEARIERYVNKIPPGFADDKIKTEPEKFGDLIIWYQIIEKAKLINKPIIFITRDQKEDWWYETHGKTIGPRLELLREIWDKAGVRFHMYQTINFINYAKNTLNLTINKNTITEIQGLIESDKNKNEYVVFPQSKESIIVNKELNYVIKDNTGIASGTVTESNINNNVGKTLSNFIKSEIK
jgi:hypothetical protein